MRPCPVVPLFALSALLLVGGCSKQDAAGPGGPAAFFFEKRRTCCWGDWANTGTTGWGRLRNLVKLFIYRPV
jgi:hypothetical protein